MGEAYAIRPQRLQGLQGPQGRQGDWILGVLVVLEVLAVLFSYSFSTLSRYFSAAGSSDWASQKSASLRTSRLWLSWPSRTRRGTPRPPESWERAKTPFLRTSISRSFSMACRIASGAR